MTLQDFLLALEGFNELEAERRRDSWERARWAGAVSLQPYSKKGKSIKPEDLARFPWDRQRKRKVNQGAQQSLSFMLKQLSNETRRS